MARSYEALAQLYQDIHQCHLIHCLQNHSEYYSGSFSYDGLTSAGGIIINNGVINRSEIIYTIALYYDDDILDYQTPFGDFVYLCFTDLADEAVNLLELLDEEAV
jgi:hypothetical protein